MRLLNPHLPTRCRYVGACSAAAVLTGPQQKYIFLIIAYYVFAWLIYVLALGYEWSFIDVL
jgi:hypothetical protein